MIVISSPLRSMNSPAVCSSVGLASGTSLCPMSGQDSNHTGIVYPKDMSTLSPFWGYLTEMVLVVLGWLYSLVRLFLTFSLESLPPTFQLFER